MTILETFIKLRDDLKLWVTNNLKEKSNKDHTHDEIDELEALVGDTSVSEQINEAISNAIIEAGGVGQKTAEGGEIFGDYDTNQATAEFAAAFGTQTIAAGKASLAQGSTVFKSGSEYVVNSNELVYVISVDCDLAISEGEGKYEVITQEALENTVGYPCILTSSGGFVPASDLRVNEAYGTGSYAGGMGAVAYSRASKSLGYRTQTGYPPNAELAAARPESVSTYTIDNKMSVPLSCSQWGQTSIIEYGVDYISVEHNPDLESANSDEACFYYDVSEFGGQEVTMSFNYNAELTNTDSVETYNCYEVKIRMLGRDSKEDSLTPIDMADYQCRLEAFMYEDDNGNPAFDTSVMNHGSFSCTDVFLNGVEQLEIALRYVEGSAFKVNLTDILLTTDDSKIYPTENIGQAAVAIGADTVALNNHAFAGGLGSKAIGANSMAFGGYNETQTQHSVALGFKNKVLESNDPKNPYYASIALGYQNTANGSFQAVLGNNNISSKTSSQTVVGKYNAYENGVIDDALFVVGNGKHNGARSNAFTVDVNGDATLGGELSVETIKWNDYVLSLSNGILDFVGTRVEGGYIHSYDINCHNLLFGDGQTVLSEMHDDNESKHYLTTSTGIDANGTIKAAGLNITGKSNIGYGLRTPTGTLADGKSNNAALGWSCQANDSCAFAAGSQTQANAYASTAFGSNSIASVGNSFVAGAGLRTGTASGQAVVGNYNEITNNALFVVGNGTSDTARSNAFIVKKDGTVYANSKELATKEYVDEHGGNGSFSNVGKLTTEQGEIFNIYETIPAEMSPIGVEIPANVAAMAAHAQGAGTVALALASHTEGFMTRVAETANCGHAEGDSTQVNGINGHAEGYQTSANGKHSHAQGRNSVAGGDNSHAEGDSTQALGNHSHAGGFKTIAQGAGSFAGGNESKAFGPNSFSYGTNNETHTQHSAAFGMNNKVLKSDDSENPNYASIAGGWQNTANGSFQTVFGSNNITSKTSSQTIVGQYNAYENNVIDDALFVVGNGDGDALRSNALVVRKDGSVKVNGTLSFNSLDSASLQIIVDAVRAALPNAEEASF